MEPSEIFYAGSLFVNGVIAFLVGAVAMLVILKMLDLVRGRKCWRCGKPAGLFVRQFHFASIDSWQDWTSWCRKCATEVAGIALPRGYG